MTIREMLTGNTPAQAICRAAIDTEALKQWLRDDARRFESAKSIVDWIWRDYFEGGYGDDGQGTNEGYCNRLAGEKLESLFSMAPTAPKGEIDFAEIASWIVARSNGGAR